MQGEDKVWRSIKSLLRPFSSKMRFRIFSFLLIASSLFLASSLNSSKEIGLHFSFPSLLFSHLIV
ncbi:MAG: hypothetical protein D6735_06485 [Acidobacteria bacterium]|nr:MAG: hypothetical protein D6735_06485 [Acidobacteriota bacterium]